MRNVIKTGRRSRFSFSAMFLLAIVLLTAPAAAPSAFAADATWTGTLSSSWSNLLNWTSLISPPGSGDIATFSNAGNGNTTLNLGTGVTVRTILFDTSNAAAYTIGSGGVGSQTLTLNNSGAITVNGTVTNNETFNANIVLGTNANASTYTFTNNSTTGGQVLTIAGNVSSGTGGTVGTKTLTLTGAGNGLISGIISGNGSGGTGTVALTKSGAGTWRLSGANTYTGTTTVIGGTLLINGNQSAATGAVTVSNSGTTLGGTGTIGGTVTVNAGANIAPGNGGNTTAILNTGALTLASTSNFRVDINGTIAGSGYDRLNVTTGIVSIGGSNVVVTVGTTLAIGQTFLIVNKVSAGAVSGTFAQGSTVTSGPFSFAIDYAGGDGNDIVLTVTAVPEPSTWIGGAFALAALGYMQRRKLKKFTRERFRS